MRLCMLTRSTQKNRGKMACWSAENATKAYLRALKMGNKGKEPNESEFISALAAGNNAQLMVVICAATASSATILALVAAAHQTGGRVVCILRGLQELHASQNALGCHADCVELVVGDAKALLLKDFKGADFVLIDCNANDHEGVFVAAERVAGHGGGGGALVVGYNALRKGSCLSELKAHLLPIGEGLLVTKITREGQATSGGKKSSWVVEIDKQTGEEHVYRITSPHRR